MNAKTDTAENTADKSQVAVTTEGMELSRFDPTDLRSIISFEDALSLLKREHGEDAIADASHEIGDGFTMLDDKAALINVPLIFLQWTFAAGDYGQDYLIARVVTERGDKHVITDGGTGLAQQVREYTTRTKRTGGLLAQRGLRKSEYDNEHGHGITYYLNV